ncbi:FG-GAP-like repeat-containing protein [Tuwongella immobilis]|uniref:FG-GAP repeat protein n=1 Tax=Tuwongella immobilis TaxID=692036 RepID=A0A6C2YJI9_9BACT|nr:FG-GAP-like repeat-containing protein [Tuwongella immobilis]VIP01283.1 integrin alpha beta-propellor repeat-containing protein : Integrin alpha beta-propellor repeat-containing protein OS=Hydrogenophaga intermedia GN=BN948_04366 PE=4 SV=1: FG-GAP_2: FG-GAP_2: FG-GAP_2: FG-GAP_2: FG-GAP_2: VCBS [Tuwongella immobilis]VTR97992.1 integrin alpha beta-propellor repeat-containing protein : Integrin alpha beta-propellor repeat-containing protein OS=Hydrogenophaga intermedia GN=BN948_04366 PE=4 SV=1: F
MGVRSLLRLDCLEERCTPAFPVAVADIVTFASATVDFDVRLNDPFGGMSRVVNFSPPATGSLTQTGDGSFRYIAPPGFLSTTFETTLGAQVADLAITDSTPQVGSRLGNAVAIAADGNLLIVGAFSSDGASGNVRIYQRGFSGWELRQTLTAPENAATSGFGTSLGLSADGSILAIGAPGSDRGGIVNAGQVFLFRRGGDGQFQFAQTLTAADGQADDAFGFNLALSADGSTLVVGTFSADPGGVADAGRVIVYRQSGTSFGQIANLTAATPQAGARFGNSVAVSADGAVIAVGAFRATVSGNANAGRVDLFTRNGDTVTPLTSVNSSMVAAGDQFGNAVSLSGDGTRLAVGADQAGANDRGQVELFQRSGNTFAFVQMLTAPDAADSDRFGTSVSLSTDGSTLLIGASGADVGSFNGAGKAYSAERTGNGFGALTLLIASNASSGAGYGVAVTAGSDGRSLVIGAREATVNGVANAGSVSVRDRGTATTTVTLTRGIDPTATRLLVSGPPGQLQQYRYDADGNATLETNTLPLEPFNGPIRAAAADIDGDGVADQVIGTGPVGGSRIRIISGATGADIVPSFSVFESSFTGGIFLAAADLDNDGRAEIIVTPDVGGGGRVVILSILNGAVQQRDNFFGIDDPDFRGGARVAVGDINGDGRPDVVIGAGFGGGPRIAVFDGNALLQGAGSPQKLISDFFAFPGEDTVTLRNGVYVAVGDLDGDSRGDFIFGGGPGGGPRVFVLSGERVLADVADAQNRPIANFFVNNDTTTRGGIRVAAKRIDSDNRDDLVVGSGEVLPTQIRTYLARDFTPPGSEPPARSIDPFGGVSSNGVFVG